MLAYCSEANSYTDLWAQLLDSASSKVSTSCFCGAGLLSAPASQAYVETVFYVCGDLTAGKRNRLSKNLEMYAFRKVKQCISEEDRCMSPHGIAGPPNKVHQIRGISIDWHWTPNGPYLSRSDKSFARYPPSKIFAPRKSGAKFAKIAEDLLYAPMPLIVPNFIVLGHTMYEKSVTKYFTPFSILVRRGPPMSQSSPVLAVMYSKPPMSVCQISSLSDNLCTRYLPTDFVDFIDGVAEKAVNETT